MSDEQYKLDLIPHAYQGELISLRSKDGFVNATAMCRAAQKQWSEYRRRPTTEEFFQEVALGLGISHGQLTHTVFGTPGGDARNQGTWVHPYVAIHLAQWLSPKFAARVSQWVYDWMARKPPEEKVWQQFQDRILLTFDAVPEGYFGVFKESADIYATMIVGGVNLGVQIILDISVGQHWARHWKSAGLAEQFGECGAYRHNYPSYFPQSLSNPQIAKCYPEEALPAFRRWMRDVYIPTKLPAYLQSLVGQAKMTSVTASTAIGIIENRATSRSKLLPAA